MTGCESASTLAMIGSSIVSGSLPRARDTLSRTSAAAESGSRFSVKRTLMRLVSERLCDVISSTPSMPASESSSGFVTCDSTTSAEAPRYVVLTLTTGSSIRGYSRTESRVYEIRPISRMISDSTVANTGRLMQISGSCMNQRLVSALLRRDVGTVSVVARPGRGGGRRTRCRADRHRHPFAQLELTGRDDHVVDVEALQHFHLAVAALADVPLHARRLALDDAKHELLVALRHDRLFGNHERVLVVAGDQVDAREHAGPQRRVGVAHDRPDDDRAARRVDQRIDRQHLAVEFSAGQRVEGDGQCLARLHLPHV